MLLNIIIFFFYFFDFFLLHIIFLFALSLKKDNNI